MHWCTLGFWTFSHFSGLGEDDEFVAVRVQDPRVQNEGSWNSYVDYKIFLHVSNKINRQKCLVTASAGGESFSF
uniref:Uncharacterized protein n=1 Tax=Amphilophus citrinellus TaxID=61819 RepID=A0A3Q0RZ99_AMPCI